MRKNYSVIIPHYNDYSRLERLLSSVPLHRKDVEVLVIDDMSPDQEALELIMSRWPAVNWLKTPKNAGAGAARNVGLGQARGERLVFADSDDEFLPGAFDVFDEQVGDDDDLVYFLAEAVQEVDGSPSNRADRYNDLCKAYLDDPSDSAREQLLLGHVVPWAKVYSRRFIVEKNILFEEVPISDDVAFNVLAAVQAKNVRVVLVPVYRIFRRAGSLMTNDSLSAMLEQLGVLSRLNRELAALGVPGRMHAGSYLYRALRKGPRAFVAAFRETLAGGLLGPTIRRLSYGEIAGFLRRTRQDRHERRRI